jgi:hypothetical protein
VFEIYTLYELDKHIGMTNVKLNQVMHKGIHFSQTQQFITQNIHMATCFDSIESPL